MAGTLSVSGLISGIDTDSLISKIMAIESKPVTLLQQEQTMLTSQQTAISNLNASLVNLESKLNALSAPDAFSALAATSSDESVGTASVDQTAKAGSYVVDVTQLATTNRLASDAQTDETAALNLSGTFQVNGVSVGVTTDMSLDGVRDAINTASAGVTASIVDGQLVLESDDTGAANAIRLVDSTGAATVTTSSSNTAVVTATATTDAAEGQHTVSVTQLAQTQSVLSNKNLTGTYGAASFEINGAAVTVAAGSTLADIANDINAANAGVTAGVDTKNELVITSNTSGTAGAFTAADTSGTLLQNLGVLNSSDQFVNETVAQDAVFSVDGTSYTRSSNTVSDALTGVTLTLVGTGGPATVTVARSFQTGGVLFDLGVLGTDGTAKHVLQTAQDATFSVNGLSATRATNEVTDVAPGMTLDLKSAGTTTITVSQDQNAIVQKVQAFVDQYNSTYSMMSSELDKGAVLNGDYTIIALQGNLRDHVMDAINAPAGTTYDQLELVGISTDKDGKMSLDASKLEAALSADPTQVQKLFAATSATDGYDGVATRVSSLITSYTDATNGILTNDAGSLGDQISNIGDQITNMNQLLDQEKTRLQDEFAAMEQALSQMKQQSAAFMAQLSQMAPATSGSSGSTSGA